MTGTFSDFAEDFDELDGLEIVVKDKFTAGDAAVDVIDRSGKEQAAMSRHEIFPMRGRGNPILRRTPTMQQCEGCHPCQ